jgi:putative DNA-invertase from lambdoid prophage Rac
MRITFDPVKRQRTLEERVAVLERLAAGVSIAEIAREFKTTRQTIMRVRESALKLPS